MSERIVVLCTTTSFTSLTVSSPGDGKVLSGASFLDDGKLLSGESIPEDGKLLSVASFSEDGKLLSEAQFWPALC